MKTQIKGRIQELLGSYKKASGEITTKIKAWELDTVYSLDSKAEKIKELKSELQKTDAEFNKKVQEVIADEKKAIIGEPAAKPADYQQQISNALEFIKLAGTRLTDDQAFKILAPFQSDPETMNLFRAVVDGLTEGGLEHTFARTFEKTNNFLVLLNSLEMAEDAASSLFDSADTSLISAVRLGMFLDSINAIDDLANGLAA